MNGKTIIKVTDLKKNYGPIEAVRGISFSINEGEFVSLLGPNGSGKTTTVSMMCTILSIDSGSVEIDGLTVGKNDEAIRRLLGVVFQNNRLDSILTVKENLTVRGRLYGLPNKILEDRIDHLLSVTGASELINRKYGTLSGGEKRKVDIARALLHSPKILILDEPTTGLDPESRLKIWQMVTDLRKQENVTILLTTHYLEETNASDNIIVLKEGLIQIIGTPSEIKETYSQNILIIRPTNLDELQDRLKKQNISFEINNEAVIIPIQNTKDSIPIINLSQDLIESYEVKQGSMDEAFMSVLHKE
jgi:multidrug/hemolysin transport system ATP-binding protein